MEPKSLEENHIQSNWDLQSLTQQSLEKDIIMMNSFNNLTLLETPEKDKNNLNDSQGFEVDENPDFFKDINSKYYDPGVEKRSRSVYINNSDTKPEDRFHSSMLTDEPLIKDKDLIVFIPNMIETKYYPNGNKKYKGEIYKGVPWGYGTMYYENAVKLYKGDWHMGYREGSGTSFYKYTKNQSYEGDWSHNERHGKGTQYSEDGKRAFKGEWNNGWKHGEGCTFYSNGKIAYEGTWEGGKPMGFGKMYYESGQLCYEGQWKGNYFNGVGTNYDEKGRVIKEGEWNMSKPKVVNCVVF